MPLVTLLLLQDDATQLINTLVRACNMTPTDAMVDGMLALVRSNPCWSSVTLERAPLALLRSLAAAVAGLPSRGEAIASLMGAVLADSGTHNARQHHLCGHLWLFGWHRDVVCECAATARTERSDVSCTSQRAGQQH